MATAEVTIEGTYSVPMITHVCLEPHGLTVKWEGDDKIVCWASTQNVTGVAGELAGLMKIPPANVTVYTDYMGGGFGSKFGADIWGRTAAQLSKMAGGRPVKMFLDRVQEHLAAGNRPSGSAHIKLGANRDGKIVAMIAEAHGTGGVGGGGNVILPYVYSVANTPVTQSTVRDQLRQPASHEGPAASSELRADRSRHGRPGRQAGDGPARVPAQEPEPDRFPHAHLRGRAQDGGRADRLERETQAARPERHRADQARAGRGPAPVGRRRQPGQEGLVHDQPRRVGRAQDAPPRTSAPASGRSWRSSPPRSSASSRPTSSRTSATRTSRPARLRAARPRRRRWRRRAYDAVTKARDAFFKKIAPAVKAAPEDLSLKDGQLWVSGEPVMGWKDACRKLGMASISETGSFQDGLSSVGVGGCQFAEVAVDVETGVVKVKKIVAIQDSGLIIDKLTWESQVYGGVIMGLNYGLFEERVVDPTTGTMLNPDMEWYKLAGAADIPEIIVRAYEPAEIRRPAA